MKFLLLGLFFISSSFIFGQQRVTGIILDEQKVPLMGVSIMDKLSKKWAISDENGQFSLPFSKEYDLDIQFLGMERVSLIRTKNFSNHYSQRRNSIPQGGSSYRR